MSLSSSPSSLPSPGGKEENRVQFGQKKKIEEKEEGRVHKCKICGKKKTSRKGLKMHKKQVHKEPAQEMDPEDNTSGKQKPDSFVSRLSKKTTGNTIRNNAGFMVMESGENGENEEATPDLSENRTKPKKRKLSERLQDPIIVKDRSKQVKVNSFRTQILTLKKKLSRMQREVGTEPDYVVLIKNNLQDPTTSNPSASAGKYFVFGEGPIKEKLIERGVQFDQKQMFLMANNHNFDEEIV